ncbi:DUF1661 domain-containing protein [Porphyromonas gingivalis]
MENKLSTSGNLGFYLWEFFTSRTKMKIFSNHVFRAYNRKILV